MLQDLAAAIFTAIALLSVLCVCVMPGLVAGHVLYGHIVSTIHTVGVEQNCSNFCAFGNMQLL